MSLNPSLTDLGTKVRLDWTPDLTGQGYRFYIDGVAVSRTFKPDAKSTTFAKPDSGPHRYGVRKMDVVGSLEEATWPVATPAFGTLLPARLPESQGATYKWSSRTELSNLINSVPAGSILEQTQACNWGGTQWNIDRQAAPDKPITILGHKGLPITGNLMWYLPQAKYLRFRGLEFANGVDTIKPGSAPTSDIEFDGLYVHDMAKQGIFNAQGCDNVQVWNSRFERNGSTNGLDHNIYWDYSGETRPSAIANCLLLDAGGYNAQLYPRCRGLIITCCTLNGYKTAAPEPQGGLVIGTEDGYSNPTANCTLVGLIVTHTAPSGRGGIHVQVNANGSKVYDSLGFDNPAGDFMTGAGLTYTNCIHADPLYVGAGDFHLQPGSPARGLIAPERYGYVPPLDIDGKPRRTADAGCFAV